MNQYSNHPRQNRGRGGAGYRHSSGRSEFMTVLLFYILPFIAVNSIIFILVTATPKGTLAVGETTDFATTSIELKVQSLLPVKKMEVTLDGNPLELTKTASRTYTATLNTNGTLKIMLTSVNGMKNIVSEQINILDDTPPDIKDAVIESGVLSFRLEDSQSGVDFSTVYAYDDDSPEILPLSIDRSSGVVTFDIQKDNLTICAKDINGNELRSTITPQGESLDPVDAPDGDEASGETGENKESAETQK